VFPVPPRPVVRAESYPVACERSFQLSGKKISRQSFGLFEKILQVDAYVRDRRIIEIHPEVSFTAMSAGTPPRGTKKTWAGAMARRRLLANLGVELPEQFAGDDRVGVDDVLDAAAAAWSGRRYACGEAVVFPASSTDSDACGRVIRIVA